MHARDLKLGARVIVQGNKHGTCRFFGRTKFADGEWVGVELDHAVGKHDGIVEGIRYFQCARANTGIFLRARDVESETDAATESSTSAQSHSPSRYKTHRSRKSRDSTSSTASSSDSIRSPRSTLASPRSTGTPSPRRSHGESPRVRGQHSRTSSDLARVELESLLRRSSFLADKPKMMQDLTRLIARRPSTVEMMRSGILNTGRGVEPLESVNENEASSGGGAEQKIDSAGKPVPTVRVRLGWSAGSRPSVDLDSVDRHMYVFGENSHGELSTGDENHCYLPTEITLPPLKGAKNPANANNASDFAQVCLGLNHMVVLTLANEVLTAGSWVANLLGTDDRQNLNKLKRLRQFEDLRRKNPSNPIISISCGDRHTVALHNDGTCESFGGTLYGKLGHLASGASDNDSMPSSSTYLTISALQGEKVSMMSAGNWHTVCCTTKGEVFTFGGGGKFYNMGQLGHGNTDDSMTPRRVDQFGSMPASKIFVKSICCGGYHTMALTVDRLVYAWGSGKFGQLGLGNDNNFSTPQLVQSLLVRGSGAGRTIGLAAGENHSLCVQADGSVFSWGYGMQGQCGHGLSQNEKFPRKVLFFSRRNSIVVQVDAGWRHSIALTEDNSVYTWGHNDRGQLGLGDTKSHSAPQLVEELEGKGIKTVAAGGNHSLAFNDFFKAAQELVFLQRVREFRQVQGASKIPTLKGANLESALSPRSGSASPNRAVSLASPSNRMSGGGSNLNSPNNASSSSSGSGSGANLLPSPNPLVSAELKHMLREMATETDEELTRRSNANIGLQIEDGSEITPTSAASSAARSGGSSIANRSLSYDISANGAPGLLTPRAPGQGNGKGDSADLGADDSFILQQANQAVEQLNDAYPQFVSKSPELENQDVGTAPTVAEIISRSNVPNQRSRGGAQQQRNRSGVTVEDEGDEYRGEDDEYNEEEEAATASEEREDIYENEEHDERKYADDDDEAKSQRKQQRAAHRESGYDHQSSEEQSSNRVHSSSLRSVTHSASRTRHMSRTSVSFQGSALCIDLVYSPQVHLTHRFMSFQTHTEETAVRDMIQEYMRTVHGERNSTVMLDQLLVTPSNTVSRTSRLTHESQIASSPMPAPSPRSAMRHDHIYEYDAVGPPRYTLQLILSSVDEEENLWPLWAQEFYASLLQLCPDIAEEAKKPATLEQSGLSVAIVDHSSAIMRPCFRELRPPNTR